MKKIIRKYSFIEPEESIKHSRMCEFSWDFTDLGQNFSCISGWLCLDCKSTGV